MESKKFDEQTRDNFAFEWLPVSSGVFRVESGTYLDNYMQFAYSRKTFNGGFSGIEIMFLKHTEGKVTKSFIDINAVRLG